MMTERMITQHKEGEVERSSGRDLTVGHHHLLSEGWRSGGRAHRISSRLIHLVACKQSKRWAPARWRCDPINVPQNRLTCPARMPCL